ncbi:MAG: glycosyltransferase [Clostridia bacterium]|nr:glycosyltransferase [Clostridia bacterium]
MFGYKDNPYVYEKNADYLLCFSPYESWGNVITESKILGTPCVVNDFSSAREQIEDGVNGIIVPLDCKDYDVFVDRMINEKMVLKKGVKDFKYENEIEKWREIL